MTNSIAPSSVVLAVIAVGIILTPLLFSTAGYVLGDEGKTRPFLEMPEEKFKACVEDKEAMRFHHMDILKDLRVKVVRDGERQEVTLDTCRECHPNRETFCNRCHDAASLTLDCFGCHYYPQN